MGKREKEFNKKTSIFSIVALVAVLVIVCVIVTPPMLSFFENPQQVQQWIESKGFLGKMAFVGMFVLQVVVAFIPGEPLEIAAGYVFGAVEGTVLCLIGTTIGGALVFLFVRRWGLKAAKPFFSQEQLEHLPIFNNPNKLEYLTWILFLIPGTPKDILTWAVGLTSMKFSHWLLITSIARFPSVITSTLGGAALGTKEYSFAIVVFAVALVVSAAGLWIYKKIEQKHKNIKL